MKIPLLLITALFSSAVYAQGTTHKHGDRSHTHVVPNVNHQHGGAPKKAQNVLPKTKGNKPSIPLATIQKIIRSGARDPSSIKFGRWWIAKGFKDTGSMWCGFVNGKNAYGGYTGDQLFSSTSPVKYVSVFMEGPCKPI